MFRKVRDFFRLHKTAAVAASVASFGLFARAEGENAIDTTAASSAMEQMTNAVKGYITTVTPYVVILLGAALGITLIWVAWKWIKKGTSKA